MQNLFNRDHRDRIVDRDGNARYTHTMLGNLIAVLYIVNQIPDFFLYGKFSFFENSPHFLHFKLALCICFVSEIVPGIT